MNDQASAANAVPISRVTVGKATLLRTLMHLWPYIWPSERRDLKLRVLAATVLLFLAKLATVAVPFTFPGPTRGAALPGGAPAASGKRSGPGGGARGRP